jgi:hypothetical protein
VLGERRLLEPELAVDREQRRSPRPLPPRAVRCRAASGTRKERGVANDVSFDRARDGDDRRCVVGRGDTMVILAV